MSKFVKKDCLELKLSQQTRKKKITTRIGFPDELGVR